MQSEWNIYKCFVTHSNYFKFKEKDLIYIKAITIVNKIEDSDISERHLLKAVPEINDLNNNFTRNIPEFNI